MQRCRAGKPQVIGNDFELVARMRGKQGSECGAVLFHSGTKEYSGIGAGVTVWFVTGPGFSNSCAKRKGFLRDSAKTRIGTAFAKEV